MSEVLRIGTAEATRLMTDEGYLYLDVRSVDEFRLGHPRGAYNVPLQHPEDEQVIDNPDFMSVVTACFPKNTPMVIGCATGIRSLHAARRLAHTGYTCIREMRPGYDGIRDPFGRIGEAGWSSEGLPTDMQGEPERCYAALLQRSEQGAGQ